MSVPESFYDDLLAHYAEKYGIEPDGYEREAALDALSYWHKTWVLGADDALKGHPRKGYDDIAEFVQRLPDFAQADMEAAIAPMARVLTKAYLNGYADVVAHPDLIGDILPLQDRRRRTSDG